MKKMKFFLAALACMIGHSANASSYTYDFDALFGQYYNPFLPPFTPAPGGTLKGSFTIDDVFNITDFSLNTTDYLGGTRTYNKGDTGDTATFSYVAPSGGLPAYRNFTFFDSTPVINPVRPGSVALLVLSVAGDFAPGDEFKIAPIQTRELLRDASNLLFNRDQVVLSAGQSATLAPVSAVPLPAGFPLLLAGLGALFVMARRTKAVA
jgi:hypothetical protein